MLVDGISLGQFRYAADVVSNAYYRENVIVARDSHDLESRPRRGDRAAGPRPLCQARLAVRDSRGSGSRTAAGGRHGPYACWHAYRDVLAEIFGQHPETVVTAGHAWRVTYRGMAGFLELYPQTGGKNIGSRTSPVTMPQLCECVATAHQDAYLATARAAERTAARLQAARMVAESREAASLRHVGEGVILEYARLEIPEITAERERVRQLIEDRNRRVRRAAELSMREEELLAAHAQRRYEDPNYVAPELRTAAEIDGSLMDRARKQEAETDELLNDPVFGPRLIRGTWSG